MWTMKDYDIERPDSDYPGFDEYFGYADDKYVEPMEWDLFEDDDEEVWLDDDDEW